MNIKINKGFTLIELLVVIAIIGILSAVVLASLNTARDKGNDAAIQTDLHSLQTQAELFYYNNNPNSYGDSGDMPGICVVGSGAGPLFGDPAIVKQIDAVDRANGSGTVNCRNSKTAYAVSSQLKDDPSKYWCVDSTGKAGSSGTALTSGTSCP